MLAVRSFVVVLSLSAWFALSNHCALGAVLPPTETESETSDCPMHSAPAKKKPATKTPCCKQLRAIVAKWVGANPATLRVIRVQDYVTAVMAKPAEVAGALEADDTGPPGYFSFAESVLQESMLSHAPPVS
jgi:hypothetical protein